MKKKMIILTNAVVSVSMTTIGFKGMALRDPYRRWLRMGSSPVGYRIDDLFPDIVGGVPYRGA